MSGATDGDDPPGDRDVALIERCRQGDGSAWRVLVQRYQRLVYTIVRRAGLDDASAADVFQDVFSRLLSHLHRLREPDRLQAWIVTTAKREALHRLARARREPLWNPAPGQDGDDEGGEAEAPQAVDDAPLPDEALSELQQLDLLRRSFDRLDARCHALLAALYTQDPPPAYDAVAASLSMPLGSVGPTRARCLEKLRNLVTQDASPDVFRGPSRPL
jgi:RNA polymerase sigma factor (sigma-70 family)